MKKFNVFFDSYIRCNFSKRLHFFLLFFSIFLAVFFFSYNLKKTCLIDRYLCTYFLSLIQLAVRNNAIGHRGMINEMAFFVAYFNLRDM